MSKTSTLQEYARMGAAARIAELQAEIGEIQQMFPDLDGAAAARATPARKRRKMSAAGRKAISEAQKKRWAALKAGKK